MLLVVHTHALAQVDTHSMGQIVLVLPHVPAPHVRIRPLKFALLILRLRLKAASVGWASMAIVVPMLTNVPLQIPIQKLWAHFFAMLTLVLPVLTNSVATNVSVEVATL